MNFEENIEANNKNHINHHLDYTTSDDGWYARAVSKITEWAKPFLDRKTDEFIKKSIARLAKNDETLAQMIEFEVNRRRNTGIPQDVTEPLLWIGVKTFAALGVAILAETLKEGKFKNIGRISALSIVLNNGVELFRLANRYESGLSGGVMTAQERSRSIKETGVDPFGNGGRLIHNPAQQNLAQTPDEEEITNQKKPEKKWSYGKNKRNPLEFSIVSPEPVALQTR